MKSNLIMRRAAFVAAAYALSALPLSGQDQPLTGSETAKLIDKNGMAIALLSPAVRTLRSHILSFEFQPGMNKIIYVGVDSNDPSTFVVRRISLGKGDDTDLLTTRQSDPKSSNPFRLSGWSGDGRFLLVAQHGVGEATHSPAVTYSLIDFTELDAGPKTVRLPSSFDSSRLSARWNPAHTAILFSTGPGRSAIFSPGIGTFEQFSVDANTVALGWQNNSSVLLKSGDALSAYDFVKKSSQAVPAGDAAPVREPDDKEALADDVVGPSHVAAYPGIALVAETHPIRRNVHVGNFAVHALWLQRDAKFGIQNAALAAALPADEHPMARWQDEGKYIAYLLRGDLCVSAITARPATAWELAENGFPVPCRELQPIAMSNLKQLGLALIQYTQDNDEKYPPAGNINDAIYPYLKTNKLFALGKSHFEYHAPADLNLANMAAPADVVVGNFDTNCSKTELYADGHVRSIPNNEDKSPDSSADH